jgi:alkylation response protein AidB-like acyl-CoA dehydrogenase
VNLNLDDGQFELGRIARNLFESRCPLTTVRQLEEDPLGYQPELWTEMAGLDWLSLTWPESLGGSGASLLDLYPIYQEFGRNLVPSPHLTSAVIAGEVLCREAEPRTELLAAMAAGEAVVSVALTEADGSFGPDAVGLPARLDIDGYRLSGVKLLVPYAHVARHLLVVTRTGAGPDGVTLFLVDPGAPGVHVERTANTANWPLCAVTFDDVVVPAEAVVGQVGHGWSILDPVLQRAMVLRNAEVIGAGQRLLELAVEYALNRQQFGTPIGKFQAVQYLCTDIAIDTHLATLFTRQAAWRLDEGLPARREVALAKAHGSRTAQRVVHRTHEVFAGVAFMMESDVQLYTRRAKHWEFDLGDARYHDDVVAAGLEASPA